MSFISKRGSLRSQTICAYYALDASKRLKKSSSLRSLRVSIVFSWQVVLWSGVVSLFIALPARDFEQLEHPEGKSR